jgi:hypothetical protein
MLQKVQEKQTCGQRAAGGAGGEVTDGVQRRSSEIEMERRTRGARQRGSHDLPARLPSRLRVVPEGQYSRGQIVIKKIYSIHS